MATKVAKKYIYIFSRGLRNISFISNTIKVYNREKKSILCNFSTVAITASVQVVTIIVPNFCNCSRNQTVESGICSKNGTAITLYASASNQTPLTELMTKLVGELC